MTLDDETASLIEEARHLLASNQWTTGWAESLADRLLDALEAARAARDAEVEELRAERDRLDESFDRDLPWRYDEVVAHRNQLAAEIEELHARLAKVREWAEGIALQPDPPADDEMAGQINAAGDVLAILGESPTERETPAGEGRE